ncbi:DNA processing protein DprA [Rhizocola hellebori]|uniref:DNA processing protein DprA n=1 Tax=Rhizocola hellebori TaxID=1392758 RepID=A0A8J3Q8W0_9ACTN|nr:DNA-processing protein DprA [Rhizocola hellebori]GIH06046.1 DNA processing protein DprA [Rhizocola hellebori]
MTVDDEVLAARVVLGWIVEPGNRELYHLVSQAGPVEALARVVSGNAPKTLAAAAAARLRHHEPARIAGHLLSRAQRLGVRIVVPESEEWPSCLDDLSRISLPTHDRFDRDTFPPHAIWVRGTERLDRLAARSVAIVGARDCTDYGAHLAADFAYGLATRGWAIISGGAYGIDAAAHRGCLAAQGHTVAVLACGVDQPYPPSNTGLFEHIASSGLVISEWPPESAPHRHRFIIRNRVIAALARGTVLVEAALRSGARNTLRRARQLGRPALVVPGKATSEQSAGCHAELRQEGDLRPRLVTRVEHVLEEIGEIGVDLAEPERGPARPQDTLDGPELQLFDAAPKRGAITPAEFAARAGVGLLEALAVLPSLALRGHLRMHPDGTYSLAPPQRDRA